MAGYTLTYYDQTGLSYTLNDNATRFLNRGGMLGFGFPQGDVTTQRVPYTHGTALVSTTPYAQPREMQVSLTIKVADGGTYSDLRTAYETLVRILSPWVGTTRTDLHGGTMYLGKLYVTKPDGSTVRGIDCWCTNVSDLQEDGPYAGVVDVTFMAPYPFWYDPNGLVTTAISGTAASGASFPWTFPITFTDGNVDSDASVENAGDVETWPKIRIYGPGDNPDVDNDTTGKTWSCTQTMDANDYIDVNMQLGTIYFWDNSGGTYTSILSTMDAGAQFWPLIKGDNTIHVELANVPNLAGVVYYYPYYLTI